MLNASIRMRLTMWYGGVLAVVLFVFGSVIYFTMAHQMLSRIDHGLREEMADVLSEVDRAEGRDSMLEWLERRFGKHQGFDFQISTPSGDRVFVNERLGDEIMPIPTSLTQGGHVFESHGRAAAKRRRIVTRQVEGPEGMLIVQVARSLDFYDHEMGELLFVLLLTGPLTLLAALGGGYFLARRALGPVDRMTETASRIEGKHLNQRLEVANPNDELGRLATTLNGMLDRLERSFREMQRFTADASHELRTPISVVRTEAEVALAKPLSDGEKQELLSNVLEECERLTWITEQLLTLSREDAGISPFKREPINLGQLAGEVVGTMRPLAEAKQQELTGYADGEAFVSGDAERLRHVVYNLLDNAIKYTPVGGRIDLTVRHEGNATLLSVRDTGIGISTEHLPHVFKRFYRVDKARTRMEGGSGLGLSIVESIVAAHGGKVELDSKVGGGTTVHVTLPTREGSM